MQAKLRHLWESVRASYWFIPAIMTLSSVGLAIGMLEVDRRVDPEWVSSIGWLYQGTANGARSLLATVAGSMITVAGVVFSITIVVLSLASSQFGPRLLRNFLRDTGNEVVLGTFIATFLYCLLVLRAVRGEEEAAFVPQLAVSVGVLSAIASLGVLIYFIQHVASMIRVEHVIASAAADAHETVDHLYPSRMGAPRADARGTAAAPPEVLDRVWVELAARAGGYIQSIDGDGLIEEAMKHDLVVELLHHPGAFVVEGTPLLRVGLAGAGRDAPERSAPDELHAHIFFGRTRTPLHDPEAAIERLVEIAVRALSPGINDPFTAITCIHHLGAILRRVALEPVPSPYRCDADGRVRLIAEPFSFDRLADAAIHLIRQYGRTNADVAIRLLDLLELVAKSGPRAAVLATLRRHADAIVSGTDEAALAAFDRARIRRRYADIRSTLGEIA